MPSKDPFASLPVPLDLRPMEARLVEDLPEGAGWQYEPKWDGFRCLGFRAGQAVDLRAKSGKPLARYFPEVVEMLQELPQRRFVLDGELAISTGGSFSFDALQLRLHPAESRVRTLAAATPATLILFDLLVDAEGNSLLEQPLAHRREALEAFFDAAGQHRRLRLSPYTLQRSSARRWLNRRSMALDGVVAKRLDGAYLPGERAMLKVKRHRTADCVVGGFRYAANSDLAGSLLLGLYDKEGRLDYVGFTATISNKERPDLTKRLEALAGPSAFTGKSPGGQSRWSTERTAEWQPLRPKLVVEVSYDQVTAGRFRHGTKLIRWRPDKEPRQCTLDQIQ